MIDNKVFALCMSQRIVELISLPIFNLLEFLLKKRTENREQRKNDVLILLTACVKPDMNQKYSVVNDKNTRLNQYIDAICFYAKMTPANILFVDNSGCDISENWHVKELIRQGRIEILSYYDDSVSKKGKGYGEYHIIKYASENSNLWKNAKCIIKITGRLKVLNIKYWVCKAYNLSNYSKPFIIAQRKRKCEWIYSMCFICDKNFFSNEYFVHMARVNECDGLEYSFEKGLYDYVVNDWRNGRYITPSFPFMIRGILGATGEPYKSHTFQEVFRCLIQKI